MKPKLFSRASVLVLVAGASILSVVGAAAPASASLATLKAACATRDAADNDLTNGTQLPYTFCDDGVPAAGGRTVNAGAANAIAVPQRYNGFAGLPAKVTPDANAGADANGDIALDVDVSIPDATLNPAPAGGYPLIAMMHGCCSGSKKSWEAPTIDSPGELWHYSNAWFAARGYVVLNFTARGFVDGNGNGSTGETQIDSRNYEINDFQYLAGVLADDSFFGVDPAKVAVTGGSYGGGFSWLALTDPTWTSPGGASMSLAAAAPKYGWTDLVSSLVPNGYQRRDQLPATDGSTSTSPLGFPKKSILAGLYASGKTGIPPGTSHATFPAFVDDAFACLNSSDPFETNPVCASTISQTLPSFINDRSAYYQNGFFFGLRHGLIDPVPVFSAGTLTDRLFPSNEHRRMVERLKRASSGYPVQEYYGDYQHFVQNKAREWGDVCGADRHVCALADYSGNLNSAPAGLTTTGVTTRLNRFVDHYTAPPGNPSEPTPTFDVTASLQICPQNASAAYPADGPGQQFTAATFDALAPNRLIVTETGYGFTTNNVEPNHHAANADPIFNFASNGGKCAVETTPAGSGVATYDSVALTSAYTMIGRTRVRVQHSGAGQGIQLNARLYDVFPDGTQVLVDRGVRRVLHANDDTTFDLEANGWGFPAGHRIRIELTQDDDPYIKSSVQASALTISGVTLNIPIREASATITGSIVP
jgi:acetyl esterase/lipase